MMTLWKFWLWLRAIAGSCMGGCVSNRHEHLRESGGYSPPGNFENQVVLVHIFCIVLFQKISIPPPMEGFLVWTPPPLRNIQLAPHFPLKMLAFETPHPLGISNDLRWRGYGYFLELHILRVILTLTFQISGPFGWWVGGCGRTHPSHPLAEDPVDFYVARYTVSVFPKVQFELLSPGWIAI